MRVVLWLDVIGPHVLHRTENCEQNAGPCQLVSLAYHHCRKAANNGNIEDMSSLQSYRVSAYNTSKFSENKIHDDKVARKYGFSGGLVPGVDVLAYMLHMPVAKWGRAFLERGLIEARFVKPVYDGEIAEVSAVEEAGGLSMEVQSRGDLCATGSASLPASAPTYSLADYTAVAAVKERKPVNAASY